MRPRSRRFRGKRKLFRKKRQYIFAAAIFGIFLIVHAQLKIAASKNGFLRKFEEAAGNIGHWFFEPKPFLPKHVSQSIHNVHPVAAINHAQQLPIAQGPKPVTPPSNYAGKPMVVNSVEGDDDEDDDDSKNEKDASGSTKETESTSTSTNTTSARAVPVEEKRVPVTPQPVKKMAVPESPPPSRPFPVEPVKLAKNFVANRVLAIHPPLVGQANECRDWRLLATDPNELHIYKKHFTSVHFTDWYLYVSFFNELWHSIHRNDSRRPVYVDIGANHAKRWSNTYFFDRCLGWDGVCAEPNPDYHTDLRNERNCALIDSCLADVPKTVNFSLTGAYGGVVKEKKDADEWGIDHKLNYADAKFSLIHKGFEQMNCTTLGKEFKVLGVKKVDFLSLDATGYEFPVLQGIDWEYTQIDIIATECKRPDIEDFLEDKGYVKFMGALKDDIFIRRDAGYKPSAVYAGWLKTLNRNDFKMRPWSAPKTWKDVLQYDHK